MSTTNPITLLQQKCGIAADGVWGPNTFKAAAKHYNLTPEQAAHFFGQCATESGNFTVFTENLNYSDVGLVTTFKKYFPNIQATVGYARQPQKIANKVYANRMCNGDAASGDGWKFRGRGPIQLTGKENYQAFATSIGRPDVMSNPDIVATELGFEAAMFFFKKNKLFDIAKQGVTVPIITDISKKVNGGTHGLKDRIDKTIKFYGWR